MSKNSKLIFSETSSVWFKKICAIYNIKLNKIGLNHKDFYDKLKWKNGFYVINLSQTLPGTHWTVVAISKNKDIAYCFDSYGVIPDDTIIKSLKKNNINKIHFTNYAIQSINSKACGYFCLAFMLAMNKKIDLKNFEFFMNMFTPYTIQNEQILKSFLNK